VSARTPAARVEHEMKNREQPFVEGRKHPENDAILQRRINELGLKVEGSVLEVLIRELEYELLSRGISRVKPRCYLTDEWGCPEGVPIIGIPYYLADERVKKAAAEVVEGATESEILMYLRHEMGHVFNYAYRLYARNDWTELFGPYSRPYLENYRPKPFSRDFVRHIAGWYAQKHPDEDFAETFAVWLSPGSDWKSRYGAGALRKLEYVDRIVKEVGAAEPLVPQPAPEPGPGAAGGGGAEGAVESLTYTVQEHIERYREPKIDVPPFFDGDLRDLFDGRPERPDAEPAALFLERHRRRIVKRVSHWTGVREGIVGSLIDHLIERARGLGLVAERRRTARRLIDIIAYATTLAMNFLYIGTFIPGLPPVAADGLEAGSVSLSGAAAAVRGEGAPAAATSSPDGGGGGRNPGGEAPVPAAAAAKPDGGEESRCDPSA
jgi:hypothetical protein